MDKFFFLIRHGQSQANANNCSLSFETIDPLTQKGKEQASYTGKIINSLLDEKSLLISSTLERALQTTEIIKANIKSQQAIPTIKCEKLIEKEKHENFESIGTRFNNCLEDIISRYEDYNKFFIITHGHVIQSVISKLIGCVPENLNTTNCGISIVVNRNKVICFNNILHIPINLLS